MNHMSLQQIEEQALSLPPTDRELLAQRLLHSLDNAPLSDIDEAWIEEAEKRYNDYNNRHYQRDSRRKTF